MRRILTLVALALLTLGVAVWATGGLDGLGQWAQGIQRDAQARMAMSLRSLRAGEPGALALLWGLCFAYGFVHAVGPGHGKFLLGAYGAGTDVRLRRLMGLGLVAALAQGVTAIVLVYAGVGLFDLSREALQITGDQWLERASLVAIALIGLWLISRAARRAIRETMAVPQPFHAHAGACAECGHRHLPDAHQVARLGSWPEAAALIGAIAIRPCTGALFLLILTWRMDLVWQGIAGVLIMALGTASITLAVAATAVLAREGALTSSLGDARVARLRRLGPVIEACAGLFIIILALNMLKIS